MARTRRTDTRYRRMTRAMSFTMRPARRGRTFGYSVESSTIMDTNDSPDDWARHKTDDLLRSLLSEIDPDINDSGLDDALIGRLCSDKLRINDYTVTLPPGQWAVLAQGRIQAPGAEGVAYFLGRISLKRLVGVVYVSAMRAQSNTTVPIDRVKGYEPNNPNNLFSHDDENQTTGTQAAWALRNFYTPPWQQWADSSVNLRGLERDAARSMASKGITYPQDLISARFARMETWGQLEVAYLFSPEWDGIASNTTLSFSESDWHASRINRFPEKLLYSNRLREWAASMWPTFKAGFDEGRPLSPP